MESSRFVQVATPKARLIVDWLELSYTLCKKKDNVGHSSEQTIDLNTVLRNDDGQLKWVLLSFMLELIYSYTLPRPNMIPSRGAIIICNQLLDIQ